MCQNERGVKQYGTHTCNASQRAGNVDRGKTLSILGIAFREGFLNVEEYEIRAANVNDYKYTAELCSLLQDLPARFQWMYAVGGAKLPSIPEPPKAPNGWKYLFTDLAIWLGFFVLLLGTTRSFAVAFFVDFIVVLFSGFVSLNTYITRLQKYKATEFDRIYRPFLEEKR